MYILFGAGEYGKKVLSLLGKDKVAFFVDNDVNKNGMMIGGCRFFHLVRKFTN